MIKMDNFELAFRHGIAAAREVLHKKAEIEQILKEFSASLEVESDGSLGIEVKENLNVFLAMLEGFASQSNNGKFGLFVTTKEQPMRSEQIAGWSQSEQGYPCWITVAGQEIACVDRAGLKEELARLAASPQMGSAIISLLKPIPGQE